MKAILFLEDGKSFMGCSDLAADVIGEVILNTAVVGYQELITDPANVGKILVLTYPLIGNYGCAPKFNESAKVWVAGLVAKEKSRVFSNWQARSSLGDFLNSHRKPIIYGLDTRTLTVHLREKGPCLGIISTEELDPQKLREKILKFKQQPSKTLLAQISTPRPFNAGQAKKKKLAVLDLGLTNSLLKQLEALGFSLIVLPYMSGAQQILSVKAQGLVISNGPEDDPGLDTVTQNIQPLIGKIPVLGIGAGCQVIAKALGARVIPLKIGHRGVNYPISRPGSFKGEITVQNHGRVIDNNSLRKIKELKTTAYNLNDHTIEEIESRKLKLLGTQYLPVSPGFDQVNPLFVKFSKLLRN